MSDSQGRVYSRIAGTGSYLPDKVLTNADLEKFVETSDEWIAARTGIRQRHVAAEGRPPPTSPYEAALRAMEAAGVDRRRDRPDHPGHHHARPDLPVHRLPAAAQAGRERLPGVRRQRGLFRLHLCADRRRQVHPSGAAKTALVVGAETLTRMLDWNDRGTCVLFGDGAGAVVLKADAETGILSTHMHADGGKKELLWNPVGVSVGFKPDEKNAGVRVLMTGNEVFKVAVKALDSVVEETLDANGMDQVTTSTGSSRTRPTCASSKPRPSAWTCRWTASSSPWTGTAIPRPVRCRWRSTRRCARARSSAAIVVLLEAFGGGFTWGSALLRY
jgi:3-oxoacyl-[acyl-carrier-protein] synthase-3